MLMRINLELQFYPLGLINSRSYTDGEVPNNGTPDTLVCELSCGLSSSNT